MIRLFMSVDMVGSTQFKARLTGMGAVGWLDTFQTFFTTFPLVLAGQIAFEFLDDHGSTPAVDVWKVLGDEVIFVAQPHTPEELTAILVALLRTMKLYEDRHFAELPLRLKGAAWVADFKRQNIELDIPELSTGDSGRHVDFIGPDIDLGFRIAKFSRPGSLVVSLDALELLLAASNLDRAALYLVAREELKGVMFGRPYPIVWMHDATERFSFLPWEAEQCPLMAAAMTATPTPVAELAATIDDMRHFLRKMHGFDRTPLTLRP
jgi:hypothetical protein